MNEIIKIVNDDYHGDLINNDDHKGEWDNVYSEWWS